MTDRELKLLHEISQQAYKDFRLDEWIVDYKVGDLGKDEDDKTYLGLCHPHYKYNKAIISFHEDLFNKVHNDPYSLAEVVYHEHGHIVLSPIIHYLVSVMEAEHTPAMLRPMMTEQISTYHERVTDSISRSVLEMRIRAGFPALERYDHDKKPSRKASPNQAKSRRQGGGRERRGSAIGYKMDCSFRGKGLPKLVRPAFKLTE